MPQKPFADEHANMTAPHVEHHPLPPFLPDGATTLMLGTFPPPRSRWCIDFFYPNFANDMWRVFGIVFFGDKNRLVASAGHTFRLDDIKALLTQEGIALYDTAKVIVREKGTAADKDLTVIEPTDIDALLMKVPHCRTIIATGKKAADIVAQHFAVEPPPMGSHVDITQDNTTIKLYREPSTSRAYPMSITMKAQKYARALLWK